MGPSHFDRLMHIVEAPDRELDLAEAALLIAKEEYPQMDVRSYLGRIALLAAGVCRRLPKEAGTGDAIFALNEYLFDEVGLGAQREGHDPRSSLLNEVLDTHRGGPLALAILYVAVGRCLGLPLQAVALPGHALVKFPLEVGSLLLDPSAGGVSLDDLALHGLLAKLYGEDVPESQARVLVAPTAKREVVLSLLSELEQDYRSQQRYDKALWTVDLRLRLAPEKTEALRERGYLYECVQHLAGALADYSRYIELVPHAADAAEVQRRMSRLRGHRYALH